MKGRDREERETGMKVKKLKVNSYWQPKELLPASCDLSCEDVDGSESSLVP